jgi:hypothetical protein
LCGFGIYQVEIQSRAIIDVDFLTRLLVDPFLVDIFAAIYKNIPRRWQSFMICNNLALNIIFPQKEHPPNIFGVIDNRDRIPVGTRWSGALRGGSAWG